MYVCMNVRVRMCLSSLSSTLCKWQMLLSLSSHRCTPLSFCLLACSFVPPSLRWEFDQGAVRRGMERQAGCRGINIKWESIQSYSLQRVDGWTDRLVDRHPPLRASQLPGARDDRQSTIKHERTGGQQAQSKALLLLLLRPIGPGKAFVSFYSPPSAGAWGESNRNWTGPGEERGHRAGARAHAHIIIVIGMMIIMRSSEGESKERQI